MAKGDAVMSKQAEMRPLTGHDCGQPLELDPPHRQRARFRTRQRRWIAAGTAAVISISFGIWLGAEIWPHWHPQPNQTASSVTHRSPVAEVVENSAASVEVAVESTVGTGGTDSSVHVTPTTLMLISTRPGKSPKQGIANIGTDAENPQTFVAGATLQNGATLAEIHDNRVVLEKSGRQAILYVTSADFVRDPSMNANGAATEEARLKRVAGDSSLATVGGPGAADRLIKEPRDSRSGFIRVSQIVAHGLVEGYEVTPGADSAKFSRLGFRSGDVITNVDGAPLESESGVVALVDSLARGATLSVTVRRGNTVETLSVDGSAPLATRPEPASGPALSMN